MDKIKEFENILNQLMPRIFPWWVNLDIETIDRGTRIYGAILVKHDWLAEQYKELHGKTYNPKNFDDEEPLFFGDIITPDQAKKIYEYVSHIGQAKFKTTREFKMTLCYVKSDEAEKSEVESILENTEKYNLIEKIVSKYYDLEIEHFFSTYYTDLIHVIIRLVPKNENISKIGKIEIRTQWYKADADGVGYHLTITDRSYNTGGIFKTIGLINQLDEWLMNQTEKYVSENL